MANKKSTKSASGSAKRTQYGSAMRNTAAPRPVRGGVQYANPYSVRYNAGMPAGAARRPARKAAPAPKPVEKPVPVKKNRRKEREYFFIMRRGVCFMIMLLAIVWVGVIAVNYLGIMPEFTSFLVQPDLTPLSEREDIETDEVDEDGNIIVIEYEDKSAYVSLTDPIFGALKKFAGVEMTDADGNSLSAFYDGTLAQLAPEAAEEETEGEEATDEETDGDDVVAEAAEEETEGEEGAEDTEGTEGEEGDAEAEPEEEEETVYPPQVSTSVIDPAAREEDGMSSIAGMAWTYFPLLLILGAVFAVIIIIIAILSMFGRRIYKGFGIMSIIMLLGGVAALIAGFAAAGNYMGAPYFLEDGTVVSVIDFSKITDFLMGAMNGAPAEPLDPEVDVMPMTMVAGYGLLIIVIVPAVMLLLSFFARKKVPYSIFDK